MLKEGAFRAYRNLPIGWLTHANHGRDLTERIFHWAMEVFVFVILLLSILLLSSGTFPSITTLFTLFLVVHTLWWAVNGNLHIYLLDSFKFVRNSGITAVIDYLIWVTAFLTKTGSVDAVLVYGSFCRSKFHDRSDLDLRIVRRKQASGTFKLLLFAVFARIVSLYRGIPTDLQVVDSLKFLDRQMRKDEAPVVAYCRKGFFINNQGMQLSEIVEEPSLVLKT